MKRIADYALIEPLGDGNHGVFYLARTPDRLNIDDAFCAVKALSQQASNDAFRRMANELRLFASVGSPYLVRLLDAGQQGGLVYYATAYHQLGSLASSRNRSREVSRRVGAVADAARGAHALHEVGVAHRDIKPTNVLLTDSGAVLSDLGLAQVLSPGSTLTGVGPIGTLAFMEPGIARGETASRASDVWSLAATLLVTLTGRGPFPDLPTSNLLAALRHLLDTPPEVPADLDPALRDLLVRCFAPDRADRPPTALKFADELEEAAAHV